MGVCTAMVASRALLLAPPTLLVTALLQGCARVEEKQQISGAAATYEPYVPYDPQNPYDPYALPDSTAMPVFASTTTSTSTASPHYRRNHCQPSEAYLVRDAMYSMGEICSPRAKSPSSGCPPSRFGGRATPQFVAGQPDLCCVLSCKSSVDCPSGMYCYGLALWDTEPAFCAWEKSSSWAARLPAKLSFLARMPSSPSSPRAPACAADEVVASVPSLQGFVCSAPCDGRRIRHNSDSNSNSNSNSNNDDHDRDELAEPLMAGSGSSPSRECLFEDTSSNSKYSTRECISDDDCPTKVCMELGLGLVSEPRSVCVFGLAPGEEERVANRLSLVPITVNV